MLSFSHYYDKSSPVLMQFIVKGTHFKYARIDMLKQTGKDQPELFLQLGFKNVFITKVSSKGGDDGAVSQDVEFNFKEVGLGYKRQDNKGVLKAPQFFKWNIAEMTDETDGKLLTLK